MRTIREDIKSGNFKQVYLLYGPEAYLRNQYRDLLLHALVPEGDTMNFSRYQGESADEREIIAQADTMPFFAERRVILIENSGFFRKKAEQLDQYMEKLPDYLIMIFVEDTADKRSRLYKLVSKIGHAAVFETQTEETLTRWVLNAMTKAGKKITRESMHHFLEITGTDMANISSELEKLLCYTMGREVITTADIDAICAPQVSNQIFAMIRSVAEHQQKKALDYYYDLLALKEPPMRILYLLARQYNQLLQVKTLSADGFPNREIASKTGMPPFAVSRTLTLCRNYPVPRLEKILKDFVQAEEDVKTGKLDEKLSVEMMIMKCSAR
ncbi:MAG: DNA polymerase III subunit delta [Bilifractor sp.]